jgi:uncharacterized protein DUF3568
VCCAGAGAGIAYVRGASVMMLEGTPQSLGPSAEQSLSENGVSVISSKLNGNGAEIVGRTQTDCKVTVCIEGRGCNLSKVTVRVGTWGNRYSQNRILSSMSQNLRSCPGEAAYPPPEAEPPPAPAPESQPAADGGQ